MPDAVGDCNGCYACCCHCGSPPFRSDAEREGLPEAAMAGLQEYCDRVPELDVSRETAQLPCLWLEAGACLHYEHRPPICREFEVGGEKCQQAIAGGVGVP